MKKNSDEEELVCKCQTQKKNHSIKILWQIELGRKKKPISQRFKQNTTERKILCIQIAESIEIAHTKLSENNWH